VNDKACANPDCGGSVEPGRPRVTVLVELADRAGAGDFECVYCSVTCAHEDLGQRPERSGLVSR
jgi:hypothetical protein